ncbi:MAG: PBSX family phage terminase large subunit [Gammaproteobacteria bacterium]|nr:PBSX family phage terminase large subunit [Gammaproteobacteria bacterium]
MEKRARYKVFYGGRGSAKSRSFSAALVYLASQVPLRILCAREVQLSIRDSVKRILDDEIARQDRGSEFDSTLSEIRHKKTGSIFLFAGLRTSDADKIKSFEGIDIAWVEEAHTVSRESWNILKPTIRKPGSEIWISFNPKHKDDPVFIDFCGDDTPPDTIVERVNYYDNPWFPDVLQQEMAWDRKKDPDKYRHVWEGEPVQHSEAQVFYGSWKIDAVPEPPENATFYHGVDWGFSCDPSVMVRCWIDGKRLYIDREAGGVGIEIDHLAERIFDPVMDKKTWPVMADNARPETISYMRRQGYNVVGVKKGKGSIEDGITKLKGYDIIVDPACKRVINELSLYSYKIDPRTQEILPVIVDSHNHYIDALRYAVEKIGRKIFSLPAGM